MNETISQLLSRKSVRKFDGRPIAAGDRDLILEAAVQAPTAGNQQLYTVLEITDPALKERLSFTCDGQSFIAQAPMVLIFLADAQKWYDAYLAAGCAPRAPGPGDMLLAVDDALIAAQNAVTAAWSLGIGSCYIGDVMERCEQHRSLFHLPPYCFPAAMVVLGYPAPGQLARTKPKRCPRRHIVHENAYRQMDGEELKAMLSGKAAGPYEDWLRAFCRRKYNSAFSREMDRSVRQYLRPFLSEASAQSRGPENLT